MIFFDRGCSCSCSASANEGQFGTDCRSILKSIFNSKTPQIFWGKTESPFHSPNLKNIDVLWNITAFLHPSNIHKPAHSHAQNGKPWDFCQQERTNFGNCIVNSDILDSKRELERIFDQNFEWFEIWFTEIQSNRFEAAHWHRLLRLSFGRRNFGYKTLLLVFCTKAAATTHKWQRKWAAENTSSNIHLIDQAKSSVYYKNIFNNLWMQF